MPLPTSVSTPPPSPLRSRFASRSPSPSLSFAIMPLKSMADTASLIVRLRRFRKRAAQNHIHSDSGDEPWRDERFWGEGALSVKRVPLEREDTFECRDGVDAAKLVRLARASLLEEAQSIGANVLVDEQWSCHVCGPRHDGRTFKVHVHYSALAARSDRSDPQRPPAVERARGVPGLMTIVDRQD
ncbi:uncharacterized protein C8Q71DRAFT_80209 [Rhodofomes roseus]|uniref:Uncharacterized protein n=1 Tax=Rhodofomes roseus TaxID=34475 RepID=A0ABQ8KGG1_9APHY|nr:uncharacterized protein C8Q71DRAFT_80209 [Rhodofomes roseus]KAH9836371.1 hypothetical protein C8Q71DRAFT_80209 [Rhodofomes roseus]